MDARCLFCGGDPSERDHLARCDGRQGRQELEGDARDHDPDLPMLISGVTVETYETSEAAALELERDDKRAAQRRQVLEAIRAAGLEGRTDDELQTELGLDGSSERPRRWELWKLNRIVIKRDPAGDPIRRLTRTRRRAVVWIAA